MGQARVLMITRVQWVVVIVVALFQYLSHAYVLFHLVAPIACSAPQDIVHMDFACTEKSLRHFT